MSNHFRKNIIIYLLILSLVLFVVGTSFFVKVLNSFVIEYKPMNNYEYFSIIISSVSALITAIAVIVALFKEEIINIFRKPQIKIELPEKHTYEETEEVDIRADEDPIKEATKYITRINIKNNGNLPARNVEMNLEMLSFKELNSELVEQIDVKSTSIIWQNTNKDKITIPPGCIKVLNIVEIIGPSKTSLPDPNTTNKVQPGILIANNELKADVKGIWIAEFSVNAENHNLLKFKMSIEWKGVWKKRLTEMNNSYSIKIL